MKKNTIFLAFILGAAFLLTRKKKKTIDPVEPETPKEEGTPDQTTPPDTIDSGSTGGGTATSNTSGGGTTSGGGSTSGGTVDVAFPGGGTLGPGPAVSSPFFS
jgi:uncharacterized membrane protein YgcG